jgi:long-chain acyl-CoA synthetase
VTTELDTFPKLLAHNAQTHPHDIAMREKDFGIWQALTWGQYQEWVERRALGLHQLGVRRRDVVALIGDNRPGWVVGEIAAHALGALSLGLYRDALEEEVAYLIRHAGAKIIFAEDEEQIDKLLGIGDQIPTVEKIVYADPRGMRKYSDPRLILASDLDAAGARLRTDHPSLYGELMAQGTGEDVAVLCATSGTTTHPKLAMLPAGRIIDHCRHYLAFDPKSSADEYVSVLQLPWIVEQIHVLGKALVARIPVAFVEEPETMMADMREIGPTFILLAPRVWEEIAADIRARMMDASPLKRLLFDIALKRSLSALKRGRRSRLADLLAFRALRDRIGFSKLRSAGTGGAALAPETFRFFLALGIPLRQVYGQTELMGTYMLHREGDVDFDTVGVVVDDRIKVEIKEPDRQGIGEIIIDHPNRFAGYFRNEQATQEAVADGWMRTGDAGYFDKKGHLVVIDRISDITAMANGDRYSPQYIENKLKFSPYVAEAVILGRGRDYLAAIICIRFSIMSKWAEKRRIAFTTYADLSSRPEIYDLVRKEVETVNGTLPESQRVRKFILLYKELDADDGELTRTRKVRRGVVAEKYADIIESIYAGAPHIDVDTTITFQDGSKQRIKTRLKVEDVGQPVGPSVRERAA